MTSLYNYMFHLILFPVLKAHSIRQKDFRATKTISRFNFIYDPISSQDKGENITSKTLSIENL